jgi:hypothetical protein
VAAVVLMIMCCCRQGSFSGKTAFGRRINLSLDAEGHNAARRQRATARTMCLYPKAL